MEPYEIHFCPPKFSLDFLSVVAVLRYWHFRLVFSLPTNITVSAASQCFARPSHGSRALSVLVRIYTFPVNIVLTEFAKQHVASQHLEV